MKRTVYLGIGDYGIWLSMVGEPIPKGATILAPKDAKFWLKQAVPPMAHPNILHSLADIAEATGYTFHAALGFDETDAEIQAISDAIDQKRVFAYRAVSKEGGGKGPGPNPQPGPQPQPPAPTPVNPLIDPPMLVIVVQKKAKNPKTNAEEPYTHPKRKSLTLKTDAAFDGTATFECDKPDKVKFFSAEKAGTEIKFDGTANVFKPNSAPAWAPKGSTISSGVTVWAEAQKPSDKKEDITVKLSLSGGSKPTGGPDTHKITSVEVTLDIHKSQPDAASAPAFSKDDKVFVGRNLLVQDKANHFLRGKLVIQPCKPADFDGELVLKAKNGHVDAFKDQDATKAGQATALPFSIKADKIPGAGQILWAQGKSASAKMMDSGFVLGIKGVEDEGDMVTATAVEIKLDICQSRTKAQAAKTPPDDPTAMTDDDKVKKGRFVHQQDAGNHHGRALLVIRKVKPEKFDGALRLEMVPNSKTELYDKELASAGGTLVATPKDFDYKTEKNEDKKLWVQGKAGSVSAALRDSGYFLHLKDDPGKNADTVLLTVCKLTDLKATFPATPAQTARTIGGVANANQSATSTLTIAGSSKDHFDFDDSKNKAVVLIEDSVLAAKPIKLSVKVQPAGVPVSWDAPRDERPGKGDHGDVKKLSGSPNIRPVAGKPLEATLLADAAGTFHVSAYVDCNGSTHFEPLADLEPYLPMNMILVRAQGVRNQSVKGTTASVVPAAPTSATGCRVSSGSGWTPATTAAYSKATMKLTGGGPQGRNGLDRVFTGWCQHIGATASSASVPPGLDIFGRYQFNPPAPPAPVGGPAPPPPAPVFHRAFRIFSLSGTNGTVFGPPPAAAPVVAAAPLLDVSPSVPAVAGVISVTNGDGTGGDSCTGQFGVGMRGSYTPLTKAGASPTIVDKTVGQEWTVDTLDSPGVGIGAAHAGGLPGQMIQFRFGIDFRVDLVVWTNITGVSTATADPAAMLYSSVQTNNWSVRFALSFNPPLPAGAPPYAGPPAGAPGQPTGPIPAVALTMNKDPSPTRRSIPVDGSGLETRFPSALAVFSLDATA